MNKINVFFTLAIILIALSACSSGGTKKKEIRPTSTEFTSGELARYVEFVDEACDLSYSEKDGAIPSQTMRLKTKMRKIKDGYENVDYHDISFTSLLSVAIVKVVDEAGATITDLDVSSEGKNDLKKLIVGKVGEEAEVIFETTLYNSENALTWYNDIDAFSPYLSGDIYIEEPASSISTSDVETDDSKEDTEESSFSVDNVILPSSLKGKVEVVSAERGLGRYGFPEITITFKLLKKVNTSSMCSAGGQMWLVGVGQDEKGIAVKSLLPNYDEWRSGDSSGSDFKDFLEGDPDDTITMEFSGSKESSDDVETDLKKVVKFKLKITK